MDVAMRWLVVVGACALVGVASPVQAQMEPPVEEETGPHWEDGWHVRTPWDYVAAGVLGAGALAITLATPESENGWWLRRNRFDEGMLRALAAPRPRGRRIAAILSDVSRGLVMAGPALIDTTLAGVADPELLYRMGGVSLLAFAATTLLMTGTKFAFRRERPNVRRCEPESEDGNCLGGRRYRSFFSGHAAMAFTAASLTCTYHTRMPLYGPRRADLAGCGVALGLATLTSVLRVVAEKHHFSDILVGAIVGFLSGFILPASLYFGFRR
tara:strand:+ start:3143 stop:3952 length:810 start_codon:yes stop_codon:yes gene_type:complete